jgi:ferritin-like protein
MSGKTGLHEPRDRLRPETLERHRAILSLMEELEAVDWYAQRADASADDALREVLVHNMNEEKEHAAMTLEWLRRSDPKLDEMLRRYLFQSGAIVQAEHEDAAAPRSDEACGDGDLRLRGLGAARR